MFNSIPNIDQSNNIFEYEHDGPVPDIEIPTGFYEIEEQLTNLLSYHSLLITINNYLILK